jgi:hypothetical protein
MKIYFVFCYNIRWYALLSPVIAYFQNTKGISHFAIVLEKEDGQLMVFESVFPKAHSKTYLEWSKGYRVERSFCFEVPKDKEAAVLLWLESQNGKSYPFSQLFFILATILNKGIEKVSRGWVLNGNKWLICTELGSRFIEAFFIGHITESHDRIDLKDMISYSEQYDLASEVWR